MSDVKPPPQFISEIVGELRRKACLEFDKHGPDDPRGAAIWDCAAWLQETKR